MQVRLERLVECRDTPSMILWGVNRMRLTLAYTFFQKLYKDFICIHSMATLDIAVEELSQILRLFYKTPLRFMY